MNPEDMYDMFKAKLRNELTDAQVMPTQAERILDIADNYFRMAFRKGKIEQEVLTT